MREKKNRMTKDERWKKDGTKTKKIIKVRQKRIERRMVERQKMKDGNKNGRRTIEEQWKD